MGSSRRSVVGHRFSVIAFGVAAATAAQLAPLAWRAMGHTGGYIANEDERFYFATYAAAARQPLNVTNPFDREWADAAPAGIRLLALTLALPVRLGADEGVVWDAARWLGSFSSATLLVSIGGAIATPAVGAAAAVLILFDPGAFYGKPILSLAGVGVHHEDDPHQLVASRAMVSSMTLPFFLLSVLGTVKLVKRYAVSGTREMRSARAPRTAYHARWILAIASVGFSGHLFTWGGALAGSAAVAVLHPRRRRMLVPVIVGCVIAMLLVLIGGLGRHGAPLTDVIMRLGAIRTHRPQFLTHAGFWAAALAAAVLVFAPGRFRAGARAAGAMFLGAWALAMLHTPILGWDIESYHFAHAMAPLGTLAWCALVWHAWRHAERRLPMAHLLMWPVALAISLVALRGPILAMRGLEASVRESGDARGRAMNWLLEGGIPPGQSVSAPRALQMPMATAYEGVTFAAPYQMMWSVPDTTIFHRAVCAAALSGIDSTEAAREATRPRPGNIAVYHDGRPTTISIDTIRVYFDIFARLGAALGSAVAESHRSAPALARFCYERPDWAFAQGRQRVRRAAAAAAALGGSTRWIRPDSGAIWVRLERGERR